MSWKSIELQVALPRTQDAGKLQDQMLKQNQHFQESLAQSQLKQERDKRKRVNEFEQISKAKIKDEDESSNEAKNEQEKNQPKEENELMTHPYLGTNIDFSS